MRGLLKAAVAVALLVIAWNMLVPSCSTPFGCEALGAAPAHADDGSCPPNLDTAAGDPTWAAARLETIKDKHKTTGLHYDSDGTEHMFTSGKDSDAEKAEEYLHEVGIGGGGRPWVAEHVEVKIAARMRDSDETRGVVVINNEPCAGIMSCPAAVRAILPKGSSLTIWSPEAISSNKPLTIPGAAE